MYGARSEESITFHIGVYEVAQRIPYGRVTSYGAPEKSRQVGYALKHLPRAVRPETEESELPEFNVNTVPWWRIINSQGKISLVLEAKQDQMQRLRDEGVTVTDDGAVNMQEFGWFETVEFD